MPVYVYRCRSCAQEDERLQPLGAPPPCEGCRACGGALVKRPARVAVRYGSWGFAATDGLVSQPGRRDFKALRERAERIADGGE